VECPGARRVTQDPQARCRGTGRQARSLSKFSPVAPTVIQVGRNPLLQSDDVRGTMQSTGGAVPNGDAPLTGRRGGVAFSLDSALEAVVANPSAVALTETP
jgi:hypothetical protein